MLHGTGARDHAESRLELAENGRFPGREPLYRAASAQFRKLKTTLQRPEKISQAVLKLQAKIAQSK